MRKQGGNQNPGKGIRNVIRDIILRYRSFGRPSAQSVGRGLSTLWQGIWIVIFKILFHFLIAGWLC